ncbi:MAG: hypothetical protein PF961_17440, partial [Planctomycetota bacterium]|nr:hypothetical protein [Planctomycetota bacterium]
SAWMHQHADAVSTCSYTRGMGHDPADKRFPFFSQLDDSPRSSWGVPWFEQSTALNKPHFVYETMIANTTKYRAEYPYRVAALAAIQGWDIVCWHTYPGRDVWADDPEADWPDEIVYGFDYFTIKGDEVMISALRGASEIFRQGLVPPAADPVLFTFGAESLYDPVGMDYGKGYGRFEDRFIGTSYRYGTRVHIDPAAPGDSATSIGADPLTAPERHTVRPNVFESCPTCPHQHIRYDWSRGNLVMDAPGVASFTGFFGEYGSEVIDFANGVRFDQITVHNEDGIAYPVTLDERYVAITLAARDGAALADSRALLLSAVSTGFNRGFELDVTQSNQGRQTDGPKPCPPMEHWGAWMANAGTGPAVLARVGVRVVAAAIEGMRYVMRDFQGRALTDGVVGADGLTIPAQAKVCWVELTR